MFASSWNTWNYSRPIAYRSYYPRVQKTEVIKYSDTETEQVLAFLSQQGIQFNNLGGLSRGIRFSDFEIGKRHYTHNAYNLPDEYYIHQWKPTNDRTKEHPVGTHHVFKNFDDFVKKLRSVIE